MHIVLCWHSRSVKFNNLDFTSCARFSLIVQNIRRCRIKSRCSVWTSWNAKHYTSDAESEKEKQIWDWHTMRWMKSELGRSWWLVGAQTWEREVKHRSNRKEKCAALSYLWGYESESIDRTKNSDGAFCSLLFMNRVAIVNFVSVVGLKNAGENIPAIRL